MNQWLAEIIEKLHAWGLGDREITLIALVLILPTFFILFFRIIQSGKSSIRYHRLALGFEELRTRVNDLSGSTGNVEQTRLTRQVQDISIRLTQLEEIVAELRPESNFLEKKTLESEKLTQDSIVEAGLTKTRQSFLSRLKGLFVKKSIVAEEFISQLEELLIGADIGVAATQKILDRVKVKIQAENNFNQDRFREVLRGELIEILKSDQPIEIVPKKINNSPLVIMVVGVNGAGKTTTIGKLASRFVKQGAKVVVGACDTFRAAAVDQLEVWADRSGIDLIKGQDGSKPSTVAYEAIHKAINENYDVVILDTAGRLHTRVNLMNELAGVVKIVNRELPGAPHETLLVIDGSTGQNALQQAKEFLATAQVTGLVVTKLDGTAKGGMVVAISQELGIPIKYIGLGESIEALKPFHSQEFVEALLGD